ncbi:hypothetical protein AAVH_09735 [Aphelenchoides avenae]|nr:hypothetical protein AAVH_09735 [Aphelenchus avenae]
MATKQKLRQRNRSTAEDTASGEEVEALRQELAEVYKKKAINDQQLIDTNNKLAVVEKELKKVTKERDDALKRMKEMEQEVERARNTAGDTLADNQLIKDELLALHILVGNQLVKDELLALHVREELRKDPLSRNTEIGVNEEPKSYGTRRAWLST